MKLLTRRLQNRVKQHLSRDINIPGYVVGLIVILLVAFDLRFQSVTHSIVDKPIRGDAVEYLLYGYNLKHFGTYSKSDTLFSQTQIPPIPDARRAPIYGLLVSFFLSDPPTENDISRITMAQAFISTITVLIVFLLCRRILPMPFALAAAALTAISPHLVTANIYVLSETLFSFMLVSMVYVVGKILHHENSTAPILAGMATAAASLTHPLLLYFIVPSTIFLACYGGWKSGRKKALWLAVGFSVLYGPWVMRNVISLDNPSDNHLMLLTLRAGAYPNLMYQDDPESYPYPNHADPRFKETSKDLPSVLLEIARGFEASPKKQLGWYLVDKPIVLWSWDMIEAYRFNEKGDVFTYPIKSTPYHYLLHFRLTHTFMHGTHWIFVVLMMGGIIAIWLPQKKLGLPKESIFIARVISLLLLYHMTIMILGSPTPRHSIPMRPFLYIMAMLPVVFAMNWFRNARTAPSARSKLIR